MSGVSLSFFMLVSAGSLSVTGAVVFCSSLVVSWGAVLSFAGCYVTSGYIQRNSLIRVIRNGIVIHEGTLGSLKRFKDDVKEVKNNYECGLNINNFNDLKVDDTIEAYEEREVARKL